MAGQPVGVGGLGQLGLGGVPVAGHQQRLGQVPDREREKVAGAGPARVGGGGPGGFRAGGGVGAGQRVGQIEQRAAQEDGVAGLPGQPGGLPEVGGRLAACAPRNRGRPRGCRTGRPGWPRPRPGPGPGPAPRRTARPPRVTRRTPPASPARPGPARYRCPGLPAAPPRRRSAAPAPGRAGPTGAAPARRSPGRGRPSGHHHTAGTHPRRGLPARPQRPSRHWYRRPRRRAPTTPAAAAGVPSAVAGLGEPGGGGVAGGGPGGGAGAPGPLSRPGQRRDGLAADLPGVRVAGHRVQRVQVVPGDHVGDFLAVAGERRPAGARPPSGGRALRSRRDSVS